MIPFRNSARTRSWPGVCVGANCPGISRISQLLFNQRAQSAPFPPKRYPPCTERDGGEIFSKYLPSNIQGERVRRMKTSRKKRDGIQVFVKFDGVIQIWSKGEQYSLIKTIEWNLSFRKSRRKCS